MKNSEENTDKRQIVRVSDGTFLVWDVESVKIFREKARIVGTFVGSLARSSHQNEQLSLPQMLMAEEVSVLLKFGFAKLEKLKSSHFTPTVAERLKYQSYHQKQLEEQTKLFQEQRMNDQLSQAEAIAKGRKAKILKKEQFSHKENPSAKELKVTKQHLNSVTVTQEDVQAVEEEIRSATPKEFSADNLVVEVWGQSPLHTKDAYESAEFNFPKTDRDRLRNAVFTDLWSQGTFLTSGLKFGCDFLVYPGDPLKFHASHMAVCVENSRNLLPHELSAWTRVATQVKKTVLLCSVDEQSEDKVSYVSVSWSRTAK